MGRVQRQQPLGPATVGGQAAARHNEQVKQSKPDYKIQLEQVTQKKKKLLSLTTYKVQAPPGYTFIPLTAPELTDKCKELSRADGAQVHVVSTSKGGKHSTELSKQVGRVGHHFPSSIVARALTSLGYDIDRSGHILSNLQQLSKGIGNEASRKEQKGTRIGDGITNPAELQKAQERLNADARASLNSLFPHMPDKDKKNVVKHAFAIGKDRIGSASELSIDRRVHLAVLAHIRHGYTEYDKLLKQVPYQTARSIVEQKTLQKIVEWRGEGENDEDFEEILREVIVIDDDDEDTAASGRVAVAREDDEEIQFRSFPIAADKIESRPHELAPMYHYGSPRSAHASAPQYVPDERGHYVRTIDPERRRRYDDRVRSAWQEAKRTYREAFPVSSSTYTTTERVPVASSRYLEPSEYDHGPRRELIEERPVEHRVIPANVHPQVIVLEKSQVGTGHDRGHGYRNEAGRLGAIPAQRQTPERREIVHQSIEHEPQDHRQNDVREVIVLDSPNGSHPRSSRLMHAVPLARDISRRNGMPVSHNQEPIFAQNQVQSTLRKRTFDELDSSNTNSIPPRPYANQIVQLSSASDSLARTRSGENQTKTRILEYTRHEPMVASPQRAQFEAVQRNGNLHINDSMHFYQRKSVPSTSRDLQPANVIQRSVDQRYPQNQYPLRNIETWNSPGDIQSRSNSLGNAASYNTRTVTADTQARDRRYSISPTLYKTQTNQGRALVPNGLGTASTGPSPLAHSYGNRFERDDGVRQHLQRLHFYEPSRPPMTPPKRFFDEQGREIIVVDRH